MRATLIFCGIVLRGEDCCPVGVRCVGRGKHAPALLEGDEETSFAGECFFGYPLILRDTGRQLQGRPPYLI